MTFNRLQDQILIFFLGLLTIILLITMLLVHRANLSNARDQITLNIEANANVFIQAVEDRTNQLFESARLLSGDFAFKRAFATHDRATIISAMQNHLDRLESADVMLLLDLDEETILANTLNPEQIGMDSTFPKLLQQADQSDYGEGSSFVLMHGQVYQFIVGFLLMPEPVAWIAIGFRVDDQYLQAFEKLTRSKISLLYTDHGQQQLFATTLGKSDRQQLQQSLQSTMAKQQTLITLGASEYVTHTRSLPGNIELQVNTILQRSLTEAIKPYEQLRLVLIILFFISLLLALLGGIYIARRISKPIKVLTARAQSVQQGNFKDRVSTEGSGEIAVLSKTFNHMLDGLEERDRVSSLLGKVVSPEIARELLHKGIQLGGEEKEVTILFSDMRNFTSMCEGQSATDTLSLLNLYLTEMSEIVEQHDGVVDKYIGDALMALFGAPISSDQSPTQAVLAALAMIEGLQRVNAMFEEKGIPLIDIGIGINTDMVVAGNMGSQNRLNYTVIGDGVNLSARLEGLTKFYGLKLLVTAATRQRTTDILYREIDSVRVKGKDQAVTIYQPYTDDTFHHDDIKLYDEGLSLYKSQKWQQAWKKFNVLEKKQADIYVYSLYAKRCMDFIASPPSDWDGIHTFDIK